MARWLRFANTLGALELLAADVCAAAAARPHCLSPRRLGPPVHPAVAGASPLHRPRSLAGQSLARSATADGGSASGAGACLARARARPHFACGARRFVLTVARRSRLEALPPSAQTAAAAVLAPGWALAWHPTVGATQLNDWMNSG